MLSLLKKLIPRPLADFLRVPYHFGLSFFGALFYGFPSRKLFVVGITGTKGKSTVCELVNALLKEAGYKTALASTVHFEIAEKSERNMLKQTMPGRFFLQKFLRDALRAGCTHAILEMTSEGAKQFRHCFIHLDAFLFLNLSPEHIESHGSYERYRDAKLKIGNSLARSKKPKRILIVNGDDLESARFEKIPHDIKKIFSLRDAMPYALEEKRIIFSWKGTTITAPLEGEFNLSNILAAASLADTLAISSDSIKKALEKFPGVPGRLERIRAGQDFEVIVDYAHTPDSLKKVYELFKNKRKICVLGNTGGGRDTWKRPRMGQSAGEYCAHVIFTNEDPYDEDPRTILSQMEQGILEIPQASRPPYEIILDRRTAIKKALKEAGAGDIVLITGKGTDPYIMGPNGSKTFWDDREIARELLKQL